jgi:dTDP-4-dehydrorhamnose reductase
MRVAVTGARGRLGRALMAALAEAPLSGPGGPIAWSRPDFDLDAPAGAIRLLRRDRPEVVVHCAAWTDVDGCAREPAVADHRNGVATGILATMCVAERADLIVVSTNEVFDGLRTDGRGYRPGDPVGPINPYGASKLAGEERAARAFSSVDRGGPGLAIVRTAWLFGPPGGDFPAKIVAAALRARASGERLRVVGDEVGSPSYAPDIAEAIVELIAAGAAGAAGGVHHIVNGGAVSRAGWAREVLRVAGVDVPIEEIPASAWSRSSSPPRWAVLEPTPLPSGEPLRPWRDALADEAAALRRAARGASTAG